MLPHFYLDRCSPPRDAVLYPDPNIRSRLVGSEVVAIACLDSEAPSFLVFDHSFRGLGDRPVDGARVDLQAVHRDGVAGDVEGVKAVAELVLRDRHRHEDCVSRLKNRIPGNRHPNINRFLFHDPYRDRPFDHQRVHPHESNRVGLHYLPDHARRAGAAFPQQERAPGCGKGCQDDATNVFHGQKFRGNKKGAKQAAPGLKSFPNTLNRL